MPEEIMLKRGDVFLTHGESIVSWAIRVCSRVAGEKRTRVNHVGLVVADGTLETAVVVEALSTVRRHKLWDQYGPPKKDRVAVYRPVNLTPEEVATIVATAERQVGKKYGYISIAAHFLDWLLNGAYFFRRLVPGSKYPICSWVVAHAFESAGKFFGVDPGAAEPDDIWDFIREVRPQYYEQVHPLKRLS